MNTKKITYDIYLGDRFFHTMVSKVQPVNKLVHGRFTDVVEIQDLVLEVQQRLPSVGYRSDLIILI